MKLISHAEAAQMLGVSKFTLYSWVSQKKVPFVKVGSRTKFNPEMLDKWLEDRSFTPKAA